MLTMSVLLSLITVFGNLLGAFIGAGCNLFNAIIGCGVTEIKMCNTGISTLLRLLEYLGNI